MAPVARRPAAPLDPAAAPDRGVEAEEQAAPDSAFGRRAARLLGGESGAAAQTAGGDLVSPDRRRAQARLRGERPRAAARGVAGRGPAQRRYLRRGREAALGRLGLARARRRAGGGSSWRHG